MRPELDFLWHLCVRTASPTAQPQVRQETRCTSSELSPTEQLLVSCSRQCWQGNSGHRTQELEAGDQPAFSKMAMLHTT